MKDIAFIVGALAFVAIVLLLAVSPVIYVLAAIKFLFFGGGA